MLKKVIFMNKVKHFKITHQKAFFNRLDFIDLSPIMLKNVPFLTFLNFGI